MNSATALAAKRILVTGHSGFTGSWASIWLNQIGAISLGVSLPPVTEPNLYQAAEIENIIQSRFVDILDYPSLLGVFQEFKPELVLHLAAQPLVRKSYTTPRETFEVNVQGTANVLEACRMTESVKAVLCITTDKVYKNHEWDRGYAENDELGGRDPYSASKSAAEIVISSYRDSFATVRPDLKIGVARGGNIIGGGDWSEDRLVPDFIRASQNGKPIEIRYPDSTRPWQHVIALVDGYLRILSGLISDEPDTFSRAFNLGPMDAKEFSVREVLEILSLEFPDVRVEFGSTPQLHEAGKLALDSSLAQKTIAWGPTWDTNHVIRKTAEWYRDFYKGSLTPRELCVKQIDSWVNSQSTAG
jgi:CDP-glucose 4,6-dehydratase